MKNPTLPLRVVFAAVLCFAASSAVNAETKYSEDFVGLDLVDIDKTTAGWSEENATFSLAAGAEPVANPSAQFRWKELLFDISGGSVAVLADLDGKDGLDLVVANTNGGSLNKVYLGDDAGAFTSGVAVSSDADVSTSFALGDVDGDGDLDLFVGNSGLAESDDLTNKLYLNNGDATFALKSAATDSPSPDLDNTRALTLGDVDGDGDLDLVVANAGQANKLYLNDGDANFAVVGTSIGNELETSTSLSLVDVDDDDDLDLIVGNTDETDTVGKINRLYINDGSGGFSESGLFLGQDDADATRDIAVGDVDNDGDVDFVVANNGQTNKLYLNNRGEFDEVGTDVGEETDHSVSIVLVDVDSDGDLDLLVGNENETNKLYLNENLGQFSAAGIAISADTNVSKTICVGDTDGDGDVELLVINQGDGKHFENGYGAGFVALGTNFGNESYAVNSIAIGDVGEDSNSDLDVVVGLYDHLNKVYFQDQSIENGFSETSNVNVGETTDINNTYSIALEDLNKDGYLDVVVANYLQINQVFLNNKSGSFIAVNYEFGSADSRSYSLALADVGSVVQGNPSGVLDGFADIVVGNNNQPNKLYLNDGSGGFPVTGTDIGSDSDYTYSVLLKDVSGDGKLDLIAANAGQANKVYLNNDDGTFAAGVDIGDQEADGSWSVAATDLNGDGDLDLVVGNYEANKLYFNQGGGDFSVAGIEIGSATENTQALEFADVDGDDDMDLLVANKNQFNQLYLNNGADAFTDVDDNGVNGFSAGMTLGQEIGDSRVIKYLDLDSDGDSEVLVGNYQSFDKRYGSVTYRSHLGRVVSKTMNSDGKNVSAATVTANMRVADVGRRNTDIEFYLSNTTTEGVTKWYRVKYGEKFLFPETGNDLRWRAELKSMSPVRSPVLSDVVITRTNVSPVFNKTPSITGVFAVGETLQVADAVATDAEGDDVTVSYQWQSSDVEENDGNIPGATASTYVLPAEKIDAVLTVKVSARDEEGGEVMVETEPFSKAAYDALITDETDDGTDTATVEEEDDGVIKRTGGGGFGMLSLLALILVATKRLLRSGQLSREYCPGYF